VRITLTNYKTQDFGLVPIVHKTGNYYLAMNPAPGFEGYDRVLGGTIVHRLLEHLSGKKDKIGALPCICR
jgi:hypothetical protein